MLTRAGLAWGNLAQYDVIVTGVRAYERRKDLRAYNHRLIEYVEGGGTLIVQYNKFEFNEAQYGPYPGEGQHRPRHRRERAGDGARARTIRSSRVPNRIDRRGVGGLGAGARAVLPRRARSAVRGPRGDCRIRSRTTRGRSAARWSRRSVGKGRWIYVGLDLWRQLPAGTDGAYQLLANLLALGRTEKTARPARERSDLTCWSSAAGRPARPPPGRWRWPARACRCSIARRSPATSRAAAGSACARCGAFPISRTALDGSHAPVSRLYLEGPRRVGRAHLARAGGADGPPRRVRRPARCGSRVEAAPTWSRARGSRRRSETADGVECARATGASSRRRS